MVCVAPAVNSNGANGAGNFMKSVLEVIIAYPWQCAYIFISGVFFTMPGIGFYFAHRSARYEREHGRCLKSFDVEPNLSPENATWNKLALELAEKRRRGELH